jgi:hypothetical protein
VGVFVECFIDKETKVHRPEGLLVWISLLTSEYKLFFGQYWDLNPGPLICSELLPPPQSINFLKVRFYLICSTSFMSVSCQCRVVAVI